MGDQSVPSRGEDYEAAVAEHWDAAIGHQAVRSFWQSPVVMAEIRRRITGDSELSPEELFRNRYCETPRERALSIGAGAGQVEQRMLELGVCKGLVAVDISDARIQVARQGTPAGLRERLRFVCANVETWRPQERFDLFIGRHALHHVIGLEDMARTLQEILHPDALLYIDEFVGPSRFQWTQKQLEIINRLLQRLAPERVADLLEPGHLRRQIARPPAEAIIAADPSESARSDEILAILDSYFEPVEKRPYGGAVYHQLFNRIMGNFEGQDELVRVLMEIDFILCDEGVLPSDYVWAVYRNRGPAAARHSS